MHSLSARAAPLHAVQQSRYDMNSPLLFGALGMLAPAGRFEVLDLTPAHAGLLEHFAQYHCKLYLPGSCAQLCRIPASAETQTVSVARQLRRLVPLYKQDRVQLNLILLWDLPNYLERHV